MEIVNLWRSIVLGLITMFCVILIVIEILATFPPPIKDNIVGYDFKRNIYRVSLIIILQLGVFLTWLLSTP